MIIFIFFYAMKTTLPFSMIDRHGEELRYWNTDTWFCFVFVFVSCLLTDSDRPSPSQGEGQSEYQLNSSVFFLCLVCKQNLTGHLHLSGGGGAIRNTHSRVHWTGWVFLIDPPWYGDGISEFVYKQDTKTKSKQNTELWVNISDRPSHWDGDGLSESV